MLTLQGKSYLELLSFVNLISGHTGACYFKTFLTFSKKEQEKI